MIDVQNKFEETNLKINFTGDSMEEKTIIIPIQDDVNFKPVVDYLIELIPQKEELKIVFEDVEDGDSADKLNLIKDTLIEIFIEYNSSVKSLNDDEQSEDLEIDSLL